MMAESTLDDQTSYAGEVMRAYRSFGIPGIDMLCGFFEFTTAKQCQSAVRQYGRSGMLSELYGVTGWDFDFRGHKLHGDWQAALGVTVRVPHLSWVENALGADIIMAFDECSNYGSDKDYAKKALRRTINWLDRCYNHHKNENQMLFPIIQGNMYKDLRIQSAKETVPYAKMGIAIGGLSVGEPKEVMVEMLDVLAPYYPENMPRYLMGVGTPDYIIEGVLRG
ncbi:MAG: tRNA-guanine transglycosylase, partial [Clostridia bacterium]|nr:tRNA-guanine transglycosylase [Clostridia bacterium]